MTWLALALITPALGALLLPAMAALKPSAPEAAWRALAVALAAATAVGVGGVLWSRPELDVTWIPALGVRLDLAADGISAPLLVLTAAIGLIATLLPLDHGAQQPSASRLATYYACLLGVTFGALVCFLAGDALVFFIGFECVLLPMWVLIAQFGDPAPAALSRAASLRFLLITALGSAFLLVGLLAIAASTGTTNLQRWAQLGGQTFSSAQGLAVVVLMVLGLGFKIPIWPLHTWLPWVHSSAPTAGSILLAGVLLKLGTYGLARLVIPVVPEAFATIAPVLGGLAVVGIVWAGLACLVETDLKRLIAWSSIAHLGFVVLGLASGTETGLQAALFGNIAHGVISALLFVVVGSLKHQWGNAILDGAKASLREVAPRWGFVLIFGFAASLGLPGLAGFWGEFGAILAAWSPAANRPSGFFIALSAGAAVGAALAAAYSARVLASVWAGERKTPTIADATPLEMLITGVLMSAILALGLYPHLVLDSTAPLVQTWLGGGS